ncbi:4Fe-4S binding protein [Prolixibacteraceae bacterium]|nr:4Fe-4S binding protein [Prolixibacteraceae bacterium]
MGLKKKLFAKRIESELSIKNGIIIVDHSSCDGCGICVQVCPLGAVSLKKITKDQVEQLSFKGRLKVRIKGPSKAFVDHLVCVECGVCVRACHELAMHKVAH